MSSEATPTGKAKMNEWQVIAQMYRVLRRINIHPAYFGVPVVLSILGASMEGLSTALLMPLLNGFLSKDYSFITTLPVLGNIIQWATSGVTLRDRTLFIILIGLFASAVLLKNMFKFSASASMTFLATRSVHHLRKYLFQAYLSFGKLYFDQSNVGHHAAVLNQFTTYSVTPLIIIDKVLQSMFSLTVTFIILCFISWKLTLLAIPVFFVLHVVVRRLIRGIQSLSHQMASQASMLSKNVIEMLSLIPLVKAMNMEAAERTRYSAISDETARMEFRKTILQKSIGPTQEIIALFSILFLFCGMFYIIVRDGSMSASSFLVYFYLVMNATNKFTAITSFRGDTMSVAGQISGVMEVFDNARQRVMPDGRDTFTGLRKAIEFRNLRFSYAPEREILKGLSFAIERGKMTALVGPTGAGKTTVVSLILRFYDVPPGTLLLDDKDVRLFTAASLRSHMAFVSQETQLLHDSLRRNICYGHEHVDEDKIRDVVAKARLQDLVERLPEGLDTLVGDRGVKLSGGEKQRVSIARALLKGAEILILDEATSSLDSTTERLVQEAVDHAIKDRTAVVIAHRLSTIEHADKIVVMDDGRCVEQGTLRELLDHKGKFAELWNAQAFS